MSSNMNNINYNEFRSICRMCTLNCEVKFYRDTTISNIFYKLTNIHFDANKELPQQICLKCFEKINEIYEFAFQCKRSHTSLMNCLNHFKNIDLNTVQDVREHKYMRKRNELWVILDKNINSAINVKDEFAITNNLIEDITNELNENMILKTDPINYDQNVNYSEDDLSSSKTSSIEVKIKEEPNNDTIINDVDEFTNSSNSSDSADIDFDENSEEISNKNQNKYKCDVCIKTFKSLTKFEWHTKLATCKSSYNCTQCSKTFTCIGNLNSHLRRHSGERPYKCVKCSKSFCEASNLKKHMLLHTSKRAYKCANCSKSFKEAGNLKVHMLVHTGKRPYKCVQCSKSFKQPSHLKRHMLGHNSAERPYKCVECSKSFIYASDLKRHTSVHSGERLHACVKCSKSFKHPSNLKKHMVVHSDERPYKCVQCSKSFKLFNTLKRHTRRLHSA